MKMIFLWVFLFLMGASLFAEQRSGLTIDVAADVFSLDANTNQVVAKGHVVVKQRNVVVKGDFALYDRSADKVTLTGRVILTQGKTVMTCTQIEIFGVENRVIAKGDVRVQSGEITGVSGGADYFLEDDYVVLWDRPEVRALKDLATGDKVIIDFKKQFIRSSGSSRLSLSKQSLQKKGNSVQ